MKLEVDTHCHTIASGHAYSTIIENVKIAAKKDLKLIAITEHGPSMPGGPHKYYFGNLDVIPREIDGVKILRGVEANIADYDGNLDLDDYYLKRLDIVLAGLHTHCYPGGDVNQNTRALIKAMENPYVDIIVHPGNPKFPIDIDRFVRASKENNVHIEINNSSFVVSRKGSYENCILIAKKAAEYKTKISIGSDAHICYDVGNFENAKKVIEDAGISQENVLNTSCEKVIDYLKSKGRNIDFSS